MNVVICFEYQTVNKAQKLSNTKGRFKAYQISPIFVKKRQSKALVATGYGSNFLKQTNDMEFKQIYMCVCVRACVHLYASCIPS